MLASHHWKVRTLIGVSTKAAIEPRLLEHEEEKMRGTGNAFALKAVSFGAYDDRQVRAECADRAAREQPSIK
jgi:hypothetical protein